MKTENTLSALVVGKGEVGGIGVPRVFAKRGWKHRFFEGRVADLSFLRAAQEADGVLIAIDTETDPIHCGKAGLGYLLCCAGRNIPVATGEKGAPAHYHRMLEPYLEKIGLTATVGVKSRMLPLIVSCRKHVIEEITAIANATVNCLSWLIQGGESYSAALARTGELKLREPGALTLEEVIWIETGDALRKSAIMVNHSGMGQIVSPEQFTRARFSKSDILRFLKEKGTRFVVTIRRAQSYQSSERDAFWMHRKPWLIVGSFMEGATERFRGIPIQFKNNAIIVKTALQGTKESYGVGAGHIDTAEVMADDLERLVKAKIARGA